MNDSEAQLAQDKAAKTAEEMQALAKEASIDLSFEEVDQVSGGRRNVPHQDLPQVSVCPSCGSSDIEYYFEGYIWYAMHNHCRKCGWDDAS